MPWHPAAHCFAALALAALGACATITDHAQHWMGRPRGELVAQWGLPHAIWEDDQDRLTLVYRLPVTAYAEIQYGRSMPGKLGPAIAAGASLRTNNSLELLFAGGIEDCMVRFGFDAADHVDTVEANPVCDVPAPRSLR